MVGLPLPLRQLPATPPGVPTRAPCPTKHLAVALEARPMRTMTLTLELENGATITKTTIVISQEELAGLVATGMMVTEGSLADAVAILVATDVDEAMAFVTASAKEAYGLADEDIWHLDHRPLDQEDSGGG